MVKTTRSTVIMGLLRQLFAEIVGSILDIITWTFKICYLLRKYYVYFTTLIVVILVVYQLNHCVNNKVGEILDSLVEHQNRINMELREKNVALNDRIEQLLIYQDASKNINYVETIDKWLNKIYNGSKKIIVNEMSPRTCDNSIQKCRERSIIKSSIITGLTRFCDDNIVGVCVMVNVTHTENVDFSEWLLKDQECKYYGSMTSYDSSPRKCTIKSDKKDLLGIDNYYKLSTIQYGININAVNGETLLVDQYVITNCCYTATLYYIEPI